MIKLLWLAVSVFLFNLSAVRNALSPFISIYASKLRTRCTRPSEFYTVPNVTNAWITFYSSLTINGSTRLNDSDLNRIFHDNYFIFMCAMALFSDFRKLNSTLSKISSDSKRDYSDFKWFQKWLFRFSFMIKVMIVTMNHFLV